MGANGALQFAVAFVRVALDVLFQKLFTWHVPSLRKVGGSLDGQVAMVTGATSGIGRETALELGRRGATGANALRLNRLPLRICALPRCQWRASLQ